MTTTAQRTATRSRGARPDDLAEEDRARRGGALRDHLHHVHRGQVRVLPADVRQPRLHPQRCRRHALLWGAFSEMILIIANIGTAVALYPVIKRAFPAMSLGFVTARVMESVFIAVGVLSVLTIVTMRQDFAGASEAETRRSVAGQPRVRHPLRVDVPARAGLRRRCRERSAPRLDDVALRPGAAWPGPPGTGRWPADLHHGNRRDLRRHRCRLGAAAARDHPGVLLGARLRCLPHREGLQALAGHRLTLPLRPGPPGPGRSHAPIRPCTGEKTMDAPHNRRGRYGS